ncbi:MAG: PQQ-binding-like beta-propeller repeat protein [Synergistaceae bacterium]|nr:PQQ-binding-like beta-propeller repeat protein [Synergistaceae bacterium]
MKRKIILSALLVLVMAVSASAFSGHEKWSLNLDSPVTSGITVSGNTVFAGSETGRFYAVNKNTGAVIWDYKVDNTIYGTPVISGSNVIFAQGSGQIVCLKISDGSLVWRAGGTENLRNPEGKAVNDGLSDGAAIGGGLVYVSKDDRKVHAFNANTGKAAWTYSVGDQGVRAAPSYADGYVFVGEYDGIFSILDAKSGKRLNGGGAGGSVNTPTVNSGNVYFSAWDGAVNAVQIKDVIPLWNVNVRDSITTQPEIGGGKIVVGTGRGAAVALSQKDGRTLWRFNTHSGSISAKPVIGDGLVFVGSETGYMYVLDAATGRQVGTVGEGNGVVGNPAYSDGVLYFGSGSLYAYE